jgi:hypothetical protein
MYFVVWLYHKYLHGVVNMAISVVVEKRPVFFGFLLVAMLVGVAHAFVKITNACAQNH